MLAAVTEGRSATHEVERYFTIAPEMIIVAGFDGFWKHVNPAVRSVLGYQLPLPEHPALEPEPA